MILRPEDNRPRKITDFIPAWEAVACMQRVEASGYDLIRQPDHARLSGELAQRFVLHGRPPITDEIVEGIGLHDEGWSAFDSGAEKLQATVAHYSGNGVALNAQGKPLSFLDIKAGDFLRAWRGSIEAAEAIAPIAGLIVSGHFYRLGKFGVSSGHYSDEDAELVGQFINEEELRRERLSKLEKRTPEEVEYWTDVLQFCDLLSLYLCCGSETSVEFPQRIAPPGKAIRLWVENGVNVLFPSLFERQAEFALEAHAFPQDALLTLHWKLR